MAHFAKVVDSKVVNVIVAEPEFFQEFVDNSPGDWIQTSYNTHGGVHYNAETGEPDDGTPLRKNYACVGFTYDKIKDAFIPPKPYQSWSLNDETCLWEAPTPKPIDDQIWDWDEDNLQWVLSPQNEVE